MVVNLKDKDLNLQNNTSIDRGLLFLTIGAFLCFMPISLQAADYCKLSDRIVKAYIKEVAKPRGLYVTGSGGAMVYDIEKVILNFLSFEVLTVGEARILYVEMMEEFLYRMNQNEKIRPYMHNYPLKSHNFDLMIGFEDSKRYITSDGHVALVFIGKNNTLCFAAYDPIQKFHTLHKEPYEESVRIVQESKKCRHQEAREES